MDIWDNHFCYLKLNRSELRLTFNDPGWKVIENQVLPLGGKDREQRCPTWGKTKGWVHWSANAMTKRRED